VVRPVAITSRTSSLSVWWREGGGGGGGEKPQFSMKDTEWVSTEFGTSVAKVTRESHISFWYTCICPI